MKINIVFLILFFTATVLGQDTFEVSLSITDSVIVVKENTRKNLYAAKVNVEINVPNLLDSLFLYYFNKYVPAGLFSGEVPFDEFFKSTYIGLNYIVEDKNQNIMKNGMIHGSFVRRKDEIRSLYGRDFVTLKMQIEKRLLNHLEQRDYDLAKYEIKNKKQDLIIYPLIGRHRSLHKGEYYLYFVYVYNPVFPYIGLSESIANDSRTFRGSFVSNKVKLIVE